MLTGFLGVNDTNSLNMDIVVRVAGTPFAGCSGRFTNVCRWVRFL